MNGRRDCLQIPSQPSWLDTEKCRRPKLPHIEVFPAIGPPTSHDISPIFVRTGPRTIGVYWIEIEIDWLVVAQDQQISTFSNNTQGPLFGHWSISQGEHKSSMSLSISEIDTLESAGRVITSKPLRKRCLYRQMFIRSKLWSDLTTPFFNGRTQSSVTFSPLPVLRDIRHCWLFNLMRAS